MKYLSSLDKFATPVNLTVGKKNGQPTVSGGVATIVYFFSTVFILVQVIISYMDTKSPTLNKADYFLSEYPEIDLVENKLLPVFMLWYGPMVSFPGHPDYNERAIMKRETYNEGTKYSHEIETALVDCQLIMDQTDYFTGVKMTQGMIQDIRTSGRCIDIRNQTLRKYLTVYGDSASKADAIGTLKIFFEFNELKELRNVTDPNTDPALYYNSVKIGHIHSIPQLNEYTNITSYLLTLDDYNVTNNSVTRFRHPINKVQIDNDHGWPSTKSTAKVFYEREKSVSAQIVPDIAPNKLVFDYRIEASNKVIVITRNFETLLNSVGNFGGIREIILAIITLLYNLFNRAANSVLANEIFGIDKHWRLHKNLSVPSTKAKPAQSFFQKMMDSIKCCTVEYSNPVYVEKMAAARGLLEESLDVKTLIQKLNMVSFLVKMYLNPVEEALVQAGCLVIHQKQKNEESSKDPMDQILLTLKRPPKDDPSRKNAPLDSQFPKVDYLHPISKEGQKGTIEPTVSKEEEDPQIGSQLSKLQPQ